ncbi:MAG: DUF2141 domain-containing protein [Pseudomonadota bacterium]
MGKQTIIAVQLLITATIFICGAWLASQAGRYTFSAQQQTSVDSSNVTDSLRVTVKGIRNANGKLLVLAFDDADAYATVDFERAAGYQEVFATPGSVEILFPALDDGPYAISILHDEDGDYDLRMEGDIPKEGYGTSNAKSKYDELSFKEALVSPGDVSVKLFYF